MRPNGFQEISGYGIKLIVQKTLGLIVAIKHYHSVSILLTVKPLSVLSVQNENQSLDVVLPFFIFVCIFFYEISKEFLV